MLSAAPGSTAFNRAVQNAGVYDATQVPDYRVSDGSLDTARSVAEMAAENVRVAEENLRQAQEVAAGANQNVHEITTRLQAQANGDKAGETMASANGITGKNAETEADRKKREQAEASSEKAKKAADAKIIDGLSAKEKADFDKLSDEDKELFLASRRSPK